MDSPGCGGKPTRICIAEGEVCCHVALGCLQGVSTYGSALNAQHLRRPTRRREAAVNWATTPQILLALIALLTVVALTTGSPERRQTALNILAMLLRYRPPIEPTSVDSSRDARAIGENRDSAGSDGTVEPEPNSSGSTKRVTRRRSSASPARTSSPSVEPGSTAAGREGE